MGLGNGGRYQVFIGLLEMGMWLGVAVLRAVRLEREIGIERRERREWEVWGLVGLSGSDRGHSSIFPDGNTVSCASQHQRETAVRWGWVGIPADFGLLD